MHAMVCGSQPGDNVWLKKILSFYHVSPGHQTQVIMSTGTLNYHTITLAHHPHFSPVQTTVIITD